MKLDLAQAARFLTALDPAAKRFAFRTFDDNAERKDPKLTWNRTGSLAKYADELVKLNDAGAGVFVTINETDGKGISADHIVRVRAVFVDLDGAPLEPCLGRRYQPHIVVESSPGKWHVYWLVAGMALADFRGVQKSLIDLFGSDPSVHDLPRVMRLPGFIHRKAEPAMVRIERCDARPPIPAKVFARRPDEAERLAPPIAEIITSPGRHEALTSLARTLSARGVCHNAILACLRVVNEEQCSPPLAGARLAELGRIAAWAASKPVLSPLTDPELNADDEILDMPVEQLAAMIREMRHG